MKKLLASAGIAGMGALASASSALAAIDLTGFSIDVTPVETLTGIVLVGLGAMWAVRKVIKTTNRS